MQARHGLHGIRHRRAVLQARSGVLRERLAAEAAPLGTPLAWAGRLRDGGRWLRAHPQWLLGGAAALALLRPRKAVALALKGWGLWGLWRRLRPAVRLARTLLALRTLGR